MISSSRSLQHITGLGSGVVLAGGLIVLAWQMQIPAVNPPENIPEAPAPATPGSLPGFTAPGLTPNQPGSKPVLPAPGTPNSLLPNLPGAPAGQQQPGVMPAIPAPNLGDNPKLAQLWQQATTAQSAGKLAEAAAAFRELLRAKPDAFEAHVNLGLILARQKEDKQALWHLRKAVALAPVEPQPRYMLAQMYMMQKQPKEAFEQWTTLAALAKVKNLKPLYIQAAISAGALAFEELKDLPQAEVWLKTANQELKGQDPQVVMTLIRVLGAQKKAEEAIVILRAAVKQFPKTMEFQNALVEAQLSAGDQEGALVTLRALEKQTPATLNNGLALAQVRAMIGRTLALKKDYAGAIAAFRSVLDSVPKNSPATGQTQALLAQTYAEQARELEKDKKLEEAASAWAQAGDLFPQNPLAFLQRGRLLVKLNKAPEALSEYRRALKLLPNEPEALLAAAQLEEQSGNPDQALTNWKTLIGVRPDFKQAYFGLMRLAGKRNIWASQLSFMGTRAAKTPEERGIYDAVLLTGQHEGKLDAARGWVEAIAKKYPRADAPRAALKSFAPRPQPSPTTSPAPTPSASPTPTKTPAQTPTATPKPTATGKSPAHPGLQTSPTPKMSPVPPRISPIPHSSAPQTTIAPNRPASSPPALPSMPDDNAAPTNP